jgi:hypothetical protein
VKLALFLIPVLCSCASAFVPGYALAPAATPAQSVCLEASHRADWWTAGSRVATGLAGAQGLATVPVRSQQGEVALGVGVAVSSALALGMSYLADTSVPEACKAAGAPVD